MICNLTNILKKNNLIIILLILLISYLLYLSYLSYLSYKNSNYKEGISGSKCPLGCEDRIGYQGENCDSILPKNKGISGCFKSCPTYVCNKAECSNTKNINSSDMTKYDCKKNNICIDDIDCKNCNTVNIDASCNTINKPYNYNKTSDETTTSDKFDKHGCNLTEDETYCGPNNLPKCQKQLSMYPCIMKNIKPLKAVNYYLEGDSEKNNIFPSKTFLDTSIFSSYLDLYDGEKSSNSLQEIYKKQEIYKNKLNKLRTNFNR